MDDGELTFYSYVHYEYRIYELISPWLYKNIFIIITFEGFILSSQYRIIYTGTVK